MINEIHGRYYRAVTADGSRWHIMRGRFLMSEFQGDIEAVIAELNTWDETVDAKGRQDMESIKPMTREQKSQIATASDHLQQALALIEDLHGQCTESFDEMSEAVQDGTRGRALSDAIGALDDAATDASNAKDTIDKL